jgi:alkylation response protein AidB-like acyl-CoA dehydrogenase
LRQVPAVDRAARHRRGRPLEGHAGRLKAIVETPDAHGRRQADDPAVATCIAEIEIDLMALEATEYRMLFDPAAGGDMGAEASTLKLVGTQVQQRISEVTMEAAGPFAQAMASGFEGDNASRIGPDYAEPAARAYFNLRKISIYGGSNEIQKNIVAKAVLGL